METSLARQLKKLAVPQTSLLFPERVKKSFLFEPSEIANLSIDEIYEIGIGGIKALQNVQRKFEAFESLLFSEKSKSFERSVQTAEVNAKLDSNINEFLILLSPHFFLRPAHKALEWLVCRYHIHMFNVDALIFCVLPYHETKYFSRVLQMIDLDNPAGTWHWLKPIQKAGVFLPRSTLYTHCFAEPSILKLICELVPNAINVHGENSSNLRVIVSFYAMTVVGTLANANRVTESLLSTLLPYILRGLKSKNKHYCISAYFIIYQLIGKCTIQEELLAEIVTRITKNLFPKIMKVGILCLLNIYQHQQIKTFPMKALFDIKNNSHFLDAFESMSKRYDLIRIIVPILQKLIPSALKENVIKTRICKKKSLFEFLKSFLDTIELPKAAVLECGKLLLMQQRKMNKLKTKKKSIKMKLFRNKTSSILAYLEKRYPDSIEEVLEKYVQKMPKKCRLIQKILNLSLSNSKHEISSDTNVSLFLGVNHPTDFIRIVSTKTFVQKVIQKELTDENFIKNTIISRLEDRHPEIVYLVLSLEMNLFEIVSEDVVFRIFVDLFNKDEENSDWFKVQNKAMELLCNHQFENKVQFLAVIFSHLISRNSKDLKIVKSILTSHINKNYSLLLDAAVPVDTINKMMEEKNLQNIVYLNCKIIEMIGQSLLRMETQQWKILINLTKTASYLKAKELPLNVIIALVYEFLIKHEAKQENQLNIGFGAIKYYYFLLKTKKLSSLKNADSFEEVMEQWIKSRKNKFPSNLLIYCLNSLVKCIKYEFEKTAQWLSWESTELKNKERILLQLFNVFTEQMNLVNSTLKDEFQRLFAEFLKLQLPILKDKLMFLSSLWSTNFLKLQSKDLLLSISSVQQIRSLITAGIIVSKSKESTDWIFDNGSTVFLSLLIALSSDSEEVRKACLNFLQNAIEKCTRKDIIYFQLANKILQKHEAILSDHEQFFQIISSWFLSPKDSSEKVNRLQLIVCQLYQEKIPNYIKHGLLFVLKDTNSKELLSLLLPFVKSRLDTLEQEPITLVDYEMCNLLLSKYSPSIANVINSIDCEAFIILEKAFKISKVCEENNKNIQEITFSIFTKDFFFNIPSKSVQQKLFSELIDFCLNCIELKCKNSLSKIIRKLCYDANLLVSELQKFNEISVTTMKETKGLRY
ncbi:HEAT repeat-containing protein 1-like, partial [Centruroides sculpturatus]|uniref:HEAT repeat-containing protein 1-like n=1 Tax=Centruroides sculpturatus TaxID=218467 RepID=UPI000C6EA80C